MAVWEFNQKRRQDAEDDPRQIDAAAVCARVFSSSDGKRLMEILYATFIDRRMPPGVADALLREAEGKRHVVLFLENLRDLGLKKEAEKAKRPA
jgi:hypothetical protein